jgi:phenylalanyl-tRNA synthetase beta chain
MYRAKASAHALTNVDVPYADLIGLLGTRLTMEEAVDRITMMGSGPEGVQGDVMTFDIFPNRPDLYSVEGIARGLRGYLGLETGLPEYRATASGIDFVVDRSVERVRPFAVGGVVRGLKLDDCLLRSLVGLQEKLHTTTGRRRRKVAIGIHDVDRVQPPFTYRAVGPHEIRFVPLGRTKEMDLADILTSHEKGIEYASILEGKDVYPVIVDRLGTVLSFPPIINGLVTQLTPATRNLFLDVTGTEAEAVSGTLNILATALAERGGKIQTVRMRDADRTTETPDLTPIPVSLDLARAREILGIDLPPEKVVELLRRMRYDARTEGGVARCLAPAYRMDLLHEVDVAEDLAIAWGYDRYPRELPKRQTIGTPLPMSSFSDALRQLLLGYGYQEVMSLTMADAEEPFATPERALILNPVTTDLTTLRSSLLPGLLNLFRLNKHREMPQRIFEVADVVLEGRNVRRVAAATSHHRASFTEAKSLVLSLLRDVGTAVAIEPVDDGNFIPGRAASLRVGGKEIGRFGEIHPRILEAYTLVQPVIAFEIDAESLRGS